MEYKRIINDWIETEKEQTCSKDSQQRYSCAHKRRFSILFNYITKKFPDKNINVLDVGQSHLTKILLGYYNNISTIGFAPEKDEGGHTLQNSIPNKHITFNLNKAKHVNLWPDEKFDLIIFSEVLEHLSESPEFALLMFHYLLNKNGHLFCTTSNATNLFKRYRMFFGSHPFDKIRYFSNNPGHYREYTKRELDEMGRRCGYEAKDHKFISFYKRKGSIKSIVVDLLSSIIPGCNWYQMILWKKI